MPGSNASVVCPWPLATRRCPPRFGMARAPLIGMPAAMAVAAVVFRNPRRSSFPPPNSDMFHSPSNVCGGWRRMRRCGPGGRAGQESGRRGACLRLRSLGRVSPLMSPALWVVSAGSQGAPACRERQPSGSLPEADRLCPDARCCPPPACRGRSGAEEAFGRSGEGDVLDSRRSDWGAPVRASDIRCDPGAAAAWAGCIRTARISLTSFLTSPISESTASNL